jgi:hypothetical protein
MYLYICSGGTTGNGNLYYGTSTTSTPTKLSTSADKLNFTGTYSSTKTPYTADAIESAISNLSDKIVSEITTIRTELSSGSVNTIVQSAKVADQLSKKTYMITDLNGTSNMCFDGTATTTVSTPLSIPVRGTLPVSKGGTGQTDLKDVTVGYATEAGSADNATRADYATRADDATNAEYAAKIKTILNSGSANANIYIKSSAPTANDGKPGDIWIKY